MPKENKEDPDNYDTLSFLDDYEDGGTKELEFKKEPALSADVTELIGDDAQIEWYMKVEKWT